MNGHSDTLKQLEARFERYVEMYRLSVEKFARTGSEDDLLDVAKRRRMVDEIRGAIRTTEALGATDTKLAVMAWEGGGGGFGGGGATGGW